MSMNLLIFGGSGMLGHKVWQLGRDQFRTRATVRGSAAAVVRCGFPSNEVIEGVDAGNHDSVVRAFDIAQPAVVVNCIGVVKQLPGASDPLVSIAINSLFPHQLQALCSSAGARLVHISTDCVFSGRKGRYTEDDSSDAEDLYGRSKFLGEVAGERAITLRTSLIGRELSGANGLVEWFLSNRGSRISGYTRAIFSGLTTTALARVILDAGRAHAGLSGVYHVSADPISKYDVLQLLNDAFDARVEIGRSDDVAIDRSLDSARFRAATGFHPPPWPDLVREMAAESDAYERWRSR
jgi:dTDP-4-dehydrorhamnose reductase